MLRRIGVSLTLIFLLTYYLTSTAQNPAPTREQLDQKSGRVVEKQLWNLNDADIRTVIHQVSKQVGKNFIIDPRVKGKVTLSSTHPLSPDELYQMFLSMLQVNGYVTVPQGSVIKIIPEADVKGAATPVVNSVNGSESDQVIVKVITLRHVPVKTLINVIRPFIPRSSNIEEYEPTNDLIITASKANVTRIHEIVERLDRPTNGNMEIIKLRHASPIDMVNMLQAAAGQDPTAGRGQVSMAPDERTNSIIINADPGQRLRLRAIAAQLDVAANNYGDTQVIYMRYIQARDIAPILANIIGQYIEEHKIGASAGPSNGPFQGGGQAVGGGARGYSPITSSGDTGGGSTPQFSSGGLSGSGGYGNGGMNGNNGGGALSNGPNMSFFQDDKGPKSGSAGPYVQWEDTTNSVIVKAPPPVMRTVKSVIAQLDIRRPQVLVDVIIAEVDVQRSRELGVEWNTSGDIAFRTGFEPVGTVSQIAGGLRGNGFTITPVTPGVSSSTLTNASASTLTGPVQGGPGTGLTIGFINHGNLNGILRALVSDAASNVVATPNIVTLDNEIANIKVGDLVSFATGTSTNNYSTGGVPFTSYNQQEVGLSLTIRPQITQTGAIKLKIENILSNIVPGVVDNGGNPRTTERVVTTNVMIDNGQILVLGGLLQNDWNHTVSKVPILGDIPILGFLFRSKSKTGEKKNMMIFLRPTILRDGLTGYRISTDKYAQMRQELLGIRDEVDQPYMTEPPAMPALGGEKRLPPPYPIQRVDERRDG